MTDHRSTGPPPALRQGRATGTRPATQPGPAPAPPARSGSAPAPRPGSEEAEPTAPRRAAQSDAGLRDAPDGWYEAEREGPHGAGASPVRPRRPTRISAVPMRREGPLIACAVGAAGGFIAAMAWYFGHVLDAYSGPWTPVGAAILIAVPVRLLSRAHPSQRTLVSVVTYLLVLLCSLMLLTHRDLMAIYDWRNDYQIYEYSIVRTRLQDPLHLTMYGLGGILAAVIPRMSTRR